VRVLVVDDEPYITDVLSSALNFEGFATEEASTVADALAHARSGAFDCIVLDVMLPDGDGFEVCRTMRDEEIATPVLFLTARDASPDKLTGLALGDDYVTKPFTIEELVARIRAVLRRTGTVADDGRLRIADLVIDVGARSVRRSGTDIELTPTEFNLLVFLADNPRQVLSRAQILDEVWDDSFDGESNIVEIYISYLRKKIDTFDPPLIHTVRGVGYTLREPRP
jgi:two-component system, OmpR family, response regulator